MCLVNTIRWIKPKLYNPFRHVQKAKNVIAKEKEKCKTKKLRELIPEISQVGIGLLNRDWYFQKNENIIGQIKGFAIYSKPHHETGNSEVVCTTTAWTAKKKGSLCQ